LIASDVASEGINLHYLSHRLIHFDIPWSLMVFQQRNGRIDRYGQEQKPQIVYLTTQSTITKIKGDMRILELLIRKDEEAAKNIGDPSAFMGVYEVETEEAITARAIEEGKTPEELERELEAKLDFDPLALLMGDEVVRVGRQALERRNCMPTLFADDYSYLQSALQFIKKQNSLQVEFCPSENRIQLTLSPELKRRFRFLPREIQPEDGQIFLSADSNVIQAEIRRCRKEENAWPKIQYLWPLNPVLEWASDKVLAAFGRHEAPVLTLEGRIPAGEVVFLISGLIPNRKSHPLVHRWFGVVFSKGGFEKVETLQKIQERTGLGKLPLTNQGTPVDSGKLAAQLPEAVYRARQFMADEKKHFESVINPQLAEHLNALEGLRVKQFRQMEFRFSNIEQPETIIQGRKEKEKRRIENLFTNYDEWIRDTMTLENNPYIQVVAVLKGM
jgi:hypothetical protein